MEVTSLNMGHFHPDFTQILIRYTVDFGGLFRYSILFWGGQSVTGESIKDLEDLRNNMMKIRTISSLFNVLSLPTKSHISV